MTKIAFTRQIIKIHRIVEILVDPKVLAVIIIAFFILFLSSIRFNFNTFHQSATPQITFLGAILEPLELEKIKMQGAFSQTATQVISLTNQKIVTKINTAPTKPKHISTINYKRKVFFKSPPQMQNLLIPLPTNIAGDKPNQDSLIKPYQKLRLYP